ncbi:16S rRNA (guanine(527)-N(7))-methyltransferase RsmG [Salipiger mucosus]|uniref:Ribosomal RNA small subunit methyltransferase G n=1 Tax=Salipiger mucosus DSM 16094 TaxID=1123237 RepID=S9RXB3_9RHOB|nr:16S rRNA (guanine(527)-N(7))-methyltransferase RsmG [Salipiger mucosus]EPX82650.1 rRNA small subunit methyltransferase, glucose inhibited division protein GidB [Salipiger mucosus DSM 16094]
MTDTHRGLPLDVSRETLDRLETLTALLTRWTEKINLVSRNSVTDAWTRHIVDSAQVFTLAEDQPSHWADLGAGGGFPGLVVAALAREHSPETRVTLVESDSRKCAFLRTALREMEIEATVLTKRIEALAPLDADVVSARALTALPGLLEYTAQHRTKDGLALFPKGARWKKEIAEAQESWQFEYTHRKSITDPDAVVLKIGALTHV